jgi:hypothetical protein
MRVVRTAYLILANTLVLLCVSLVVAHAGITLFDFTGPSNAYQDLPEVVKRNYGHMTPADVDELLAATWSVRTQYSPWLGFREGARSSRFVNVDEFGIRSNGRPPHRPSIDDAIWFFGGSTTFGYGVADTETIPAQIEKILGAPTVNFGAAYFYSSHENLLLSQYLKAGYRPRAALFLDGINETCDSSEYWDELATLYAKAQRDYEWDVLEIGKPALVSAKFVWSTVRDVLQIANPEPDPVGLECEQYGRRTALRAIHARNLAEREATCRLYNVTCLTLVQPFAGLHGRHEDPAFSAKSRAALRAKFEHLEGNWRGANSVWVADALDQHSAHAYVDEVHYSASACRQIAQAIAARLPASVRPQAAPADGS